MFCLQLITSDRFVSLSILYLLLQINLKEEFCLKILVGQSLLPFPKDLTAVKMGKWAPRPRLNGKMGAAAAARAVSIPNPKELQLPSDLRDW